MPKTREFSLKKAKLGLIMNMKYASDCSQDEMFSVGCNLFSNASEKQMV